MPRAFAWVMGVGVVCLVTVCPVMDFWRQQAQVRNFRVVREGVLYRSGQMRLDGLKRMVHDYGIRTVVSLRDAARAGDAPPDLEEENYCKAEGIHYVRILPREWGWTTDGSVPAEDGVRSFRQVMANPACFPVLMHCLAGIHRTGAFCAIYRMEFEHWSNDQALAEMQACGYSTLNDDWDLHDYLVHYRPSWRGPADGSFNSKSLKIEGQPTKQVRKKKLPEF